MLTFFCAFLPTIVSKQDGGGLFVGFLVTASFHLIHGFSGFLTFLQRHYRRWEYSPWPAEVSIRRKKHWRNHWITPSPTGNGWSYPAPHSHDLSLQTQTYTLTQTKPTSLFQKGFSGLARVASWPRPYRGREGMEGMWPKILHKANQQEMQTTSLCWLKIAVRTQEWKK